VSSERWPGCRFQPAAMASPWRRRCSPRPGLATGEGDGTGVCAGGAQLAVASLPCRPQTAPVGVRARLKAQARRDLAGRFPGTTTATGVEAVGRAYHCPAGRRRCAPGVGPAPPGTVRRGCGTRGGSCRAAPPGIAHRHRGLKLSVAGAVKGVGQITLAKLTAFVTCLKFAADPVVHSP